MFHEKSRTEKISIRGLRYNVRHWGPDDAPVVLEGIDHHYILADAPVVEEAEVERDGTLSEADPESAKPKQKVLVFR